MNWGRKMLAGNVSISIFVLALLFSVPAAVSAENVIRWASQGDALTLDPHATNEVATISTIRKIYDSLVYADNDLKLIPWLAKSWELVDPATWRFVLRDDVKWQDGTSFTAEDVKFSLARALTETSDFRKQIGSIKQVDVVDDYTVHIVTDGPNPILPNQLTTIFMMSKAWSEQHGVSEPQNFGGNEETYAVRHAMGTGPFVLQSRDPGIRTVMTKNPAWWGLGDHPHVVDELVFTPISNQATRVAALLSGEIDLLLDPPLQDIERIKRTPGLKVVQTAQDRTIFLGVDQASDELRTSNIKGANPFKDRRVRQAFYQAIDIEAIRDKVMRGYAVPAGIVTGPVSHGYTKALDERAPHDPAAAKKLLAEAGYPDGFSVRLDCPNDRYINDEAICQAVTGMLGKIGIDVDLSAQPKTLHFPKIKNRETDFYLLGWGVPTLDSHYVFSYLARESTWNATGFDDPQINKLIDQIGVEVDFAARDEQIAQVWQRLKDDVVYLPLHHQTVVWAMKDWLDIPVPADNAVRFVFAGIKPH